MKYISEKFLIDCMKDPRANDGTLKILQAFLRECKELNQWQPIETAPKDRKIMIFSDTYGWEFGWYDERSYRWSCYPYKPKAWMEIPEPPFHKEK